MKAVNETTNNAWQITVAELQEDTDGGTLGQVDFIPWELCWQYPHSTPTTQLSNKIYTLYSSKKCFNYSMHIKFFFHNLSTQYYSTLSQKDSIKKKKLSLQFNWLDFLKEIFAETDVTITKDEPLITFKGPYFKDFSNMLATTDPRTIGKWFTGWKSYHIMLLISIHCSDPPNTDKSPKIWLLATKLFPSGLDKIFICFKRNINLH